MKRSYSDMQNNEPSMKIQNEMPDTINIIENILDHINDNPNIIQTDTNNEVKNVNEVEEVINDEWNEMKQCQKRGILQDMLQIIIAPINKINTLFAQAPVQSQSPVQSQPPALIPASNIACLFISKHGGYDVYKQLNDKKVETFIIQTEVCPVENLIRYQYAPHGSCGWGNLYTDYEYYWDSYKLLEFMTNPSLSIEEKRNKSIEQLNTLVPILSEHRDTVTDYYKVNKEKKYYAEPKICTNIHKSNKLTVIHKNQLFLNKNYQIDTSKYMNNIKMSSGILIMYDVTFKLPELFFEPGTELQEIPTPINEFKMLIDNLTNKRYVFSFKHGTYNNNGTISYTGSTELMSCPYFLLYLKLYELGPKSDTVDEFAFTDIELKYGISLDNKKNIYNDIVMNKIKNRKTNEITDSILDIKEKRMMVYEINNIHVYSYMKHVNTVINLDFTCSIFNVQNRKKMLRTKYGKNKLRTLTGVITNKFIKKNVTGGKTKRKQRNKKRKSLKNRKNYKNKK